MPILNITTSVTGLVGVYPRVVYIKTNDTVALVSASGYLNNAQYSEGASFRDGDMAVVQTKTSASASNVQSGWFQVQNLNGVWSLIYPAGEAALPVSEGGTGDTSFTPFAVVCGGTTPTNPLQSVVGVGTTGYVLTSNGTGLLPTWQDTGGHGTVSPGTINDLAWYAATGSTVGPLTTANSSVLTTTSTGAPTWSGALTNGQLIIGSTGATPVAHTLTQGFGITITNGAGSITIAANGSAAIGTIIDFAGTSAPTNYLVCDGSEISRTTYALLFAVIGVTWGAGDMSTTFNIPDLAASVTVGSGGAGPIIGANVGDTGGEEAHTVVLSEIPDHTHFTPGSGDNGSDGPGGSIPNGNATGSISGYTVQTDLSLVQTYATVLKCICYQ